MIDLLGHHTYIAEPCPTVRVGVLISGATNPQSLGRSKVWEKEAIFAAGISSQAMGVDRHLVASLITAGYHIEIAQDNANVSLGTVICHGYEFGKSSLQTSVGTYTAIRGIEACFNLNTLSSSTAVTSITEG